MKLGRKQLFLLYLIQKNGFGDYYTAQRAFEMARGRNEYERISCRKKGWTKLEKLQFLGCLEETTDDENRKIFVLTEKGKKAIKTFQEMI